MAAEQNAAKEREAAAKQKEAAAKQVKQGENPAAPGLRCPL